MSERPKGKGWAKILGDAGLLDDQTDSWVLPEDAVSGTKITLDGSGGRDIPFTPTPPPPESDPAGTPAAEGRRPPFARISDVPPERLPRRVSIIDEPLRPSDPPLDGPSADRFFPNDVLYRTVGAPSNPPPTPRVSVAGLRAPSDPPPPISAGPSPLARKAEMLDAFEFGNFSGALALAEAILALAPDDFEALDIRDRCRETLQKMDESRVGSLLRVPVVAIAPQEIIWRKLDPRAGFVLSRIDGLSSFEDILDVSGLPRFETLRILAQLIQDGIIK